MSDGEPGDVELRSLVLGVIIGDEEGGVSMNADVVDVVEVGDAAGADLSVVGN